MSIEARVAEQYTRGKLDEIILCALEQAGKDPAALTQEDWAAVDEFHVGGLESTKELARQMELLPGMRLLDVGCGIGGPARYFAAEHGCHVEGIDLTEEFIRVGGNLTRIQKLEHLVKLRSGSGLGLPFEAQSFDRAYLIHVGMNIADKAGVFREVRRVLKPGGIFAVFDILRTAEGPLTFPVPWALTEETSFVASVADYREALRAAGFKIAKERGRGAFAIEFTERMAARMAQGGPPVLGLHLLMGQKTPVLLRNVLSMMQRGLLEPVEIFAQPA